MDALDKISELEQGRYERSQKVLRPGYQQLEEIIDLYKKWQEACNTSMPRVNRSQSILAVSLLQAGCERELLASMLALFRGHLSFSHQHIRKSVENTLFALNLFQKKDAVDAWMHSFKDWEKYRSEFRIMSLLNPKTYADRSDKEQKYIGSLLEIYEYCSVSVHPTVIDMVKSANLEPHEDGTFGLTPKFVDDESRDLLIVTFFSYLYVHLQILALFGHLLEECCPKFDRATWQRTIEEVQLNVKDKENSSSMRINRDIPELQAFWKVGPKPQSKSTKRESGRD